MNRVTRDELRTLLDTGRVVLIEAVPEAAYRTEHIPGAVTHPIGRGPHIGEVAERARCDSLTHRTRADCPPPDADLANPEAEGDHL